MAQLGQLGNLQGAEMQGDSFSPLPAGWYEVMATGSEIKQTQKGGTMAKFELTVLDGQFKGRKVWYQINLENANPVAVKIGRDQLYTMAVNCGHPTPASVSDTDELHGRPFGVLLKVRTGEFEGNEVKATRKPGGSSQAGAPAPASAPAAPVAPSAPVSPAVPAAPVYPQTAPVNQQVLAGVAPAPAAPAQQAAMAEAGF